MTTADKIVRLSLSSPLSQYPSSSCWNRSSRTTGSYSSSRQEHQSLWCNEWDVDSVKTIACDNATTTVLRTERAGESHRLGLAPGAAAGSCSEEQWLMEELSSPFAGQDRSYPLGRVQTPGLFPVCVAWILQTCNFSSGFSTQATKARFKQWPHLLTEW